jgi:hypothetical protein
MKDRNFAIVSVEELLEPARKKRATLSTKLDAEKQ